MYVHSAKKKISINSNTNYRGEMKLILINVDYCLLLFDASNFFLGFHLHGNLYLSLIFSMEIPKYDYKIVKFPA